MPISEAASTSDISLGRVNRGTVRRIGEDDRNRGQMDANFPGATGPRFRSSYRCRISAAGKVFLPFVEVTLDGRNG